MAEKKLAGRCIVCGEEIEWLHEPEDGMVDNAADLVISCGFGSQHDMMEFRAWICDGCTNSSITLGRIIRKRILDIQPSMVAGDWQDVDPEEGG